jgi:DNA-binding NtrC family response regulator
VEGLQRLSSRATNTRRPLASGLEGTVSRPFQDAAAAGSDSFGRSASGREPASRIPLSSGHYSADHGESDRTELVQLDQVRQAAESDVIMKALYATQWNRKRAASLLGVEYKALLYKMKKLGID